MITNSVNPMMMFVGLNSFGLTPLYPMLLLPSKQLKQCLKLKYD
ncbi:hypothetical protein MtrunA17_Chr5g0424271 [Medicago truncatula]|uniref:Transmembrane protein n=1 Tax=Medicago truncatula TaxID=3880 RepID=A0A396HRL5_MEDTR|nr:hypothetical protein MtrunA17_Chr5g0424271 [Medicago truncatula]